MREASKLRCLVTALQPRFEVMLSLTAPGETVRRDAGGEKVVCDRKVNVCLLCDVSLGKC